MLQEISENYFSTINSLASRIGGDIKGIRTAYEGLWSSYSNTEQEQIINETIIHPKVLLKYSLSIQDLYGKGTCLHPAGQKVVIDENGGGSWRDEHSAPFSWKTRSQLELCQNKKCVSEVSDTTITKAVKPDQEFLGAEGDVPDSTENAPTSTGTFSNFCSRLKLLPGKSHGYQVSQRNEGLLTKIKNNAVCKVQSTLRIVSEKFNGLRNNEGETLVLGGGAIIVPRAPKLSPKISKPSCPPPPPPRVHLQADQAKTPLLTPNTPILDERRENAPIQCSVVETNLSNLGVDDYPDIPSELSNHGDETLVPKSGFDFLDNW